MPRSAGVRVLRHLGGQNDETWLHTACSLGSRRKRWRSNTLRRPVEWSCRLGPIAAGTAARSSNCTASVGTSKQDRAVQEPKSPKVHQSIRVKRLRKTAPEVVGDYSGSFNSGRVTATCPALSMGRCVVDGNVALADAARAVSQIPGVRSSVPVAAASAEESQHRLVIHPPVHPFSRTAIGTNSGHDAFTKRRQGMCPSARSGNVNLKTNTDGVGGDFSDACIDTASDATPTDHCADSREVTSPCGTGAMMQTIPPGPSSFLLAACAEVAAEVDARSPRRASVSLNGVKAHQRTRAAHKMDPRRAVIVSSKGVYTNLHTGAAVCALDVDMQSSVPAENTSSIELRAIDAWHGRCGMPTPEESIHPDVSGNPVGVDDSARSPAKDNLSVLVTRLRAVPHAKRRAIAATLPEATRRALVRHLCPAGGSNHRAVPALPPRSTSPNAAFGNVSSPRSAMCIEALLAAPEARSFPTLLRDVPREERCEILREVRGLGKRLNSLLLAPNIAAVATQLHDLSGAERRVLIEALPEQTQQALHQHMLDKRAAATASTFVPDEMPQE